MLVDQITTAFLEDVAVFEAQQRNMAILPNAPQIDINADTGLIQARRILERIHKQELAAAPASDPPAGSARVKPAVYSAEDAGGTSALPG
jgi:vanillate O-demethylase monooxygenase subunit